MFSFLSLDDLTQHKGLHTRPFVSAVFRGWALGLSSSLDCLSLTRWFLSAETQKRTEEEYGSYIVIE